MKYHKTLIVLMICIITSCEKTSKNEGNTPTTTNMESQKTDPLVQKLIDEEGWVNDRLDEIGCSCLNKEFHGESKLSKPEKIVALVWNGYGISMNAGVTQAMDRLSSDKLIAALRQIDCNNIADALKRISTDRENLKLEYAKQSPEQRASQFEDLVFGKWKDDWNIYYAEEGEFIEKLAKYIKSNASSFKLSTKTANNSCHTTSYKAQ